MAIIPVIQEVHHSNEADYTITNSDILQTAVCPLAINKFMLSSPSSLFKSSTRLRTPVRLPKKEEEPIDGASEPPITNQIVNLLMRHLVKEVLCRRVNHANQRKRKKQQRRRPAKNGAGNRSVRFHRKVRITFRTCEPARMRTGRNAVKRSSLFICKIRHPEN